MAQGSTARVPVPSSASATAVAARTRRSRIASQRLQVGHVLHQDLLTAGLVERAQVGVQVVAVAAPARRPALIQVTYLWAFSGRRCASTATRRAAVGERRRPARRSRRPARWSSASSARSGSGALPGTRGDVAGGADQQLADHGADLRRGDAARAQQAHAARPRRQTMVDSSPIWHSPPSSITRTASPSSSRTCSARVGDKPPVAVGGRRGDAAAEGGQQLLRHRVRRHADGDGVLAAGDDVVHVAGARQHHGQRSRPERARRGAWRPAAPRAPSGAGSAGCRGARSPDGSAGGP